MMYDVALSFSGKDSAVANQLYRVLKRGGLDVYSYNKQNQFGESLFIVTRQVFNSGASNAVVIMSENYAEGYWTKKEWKELLKAKKARRIKKLFLVRLDNTRLPGLNEGEIFEVWGNNPVEIGKKVISQLGRCSTRRMLRICVAIIVILSILGGAGLFWYG
jgi:hypothetical protein